MGSRVIYNPPIDVFCNDPLSYTENNSAGYANNLVIGMRDGVKSVNPHSHTFYELELVIDGKGQMNINGKELEAKRGFLHFADPMDSHSFIADEPFTLWNVSFIDCDIYSDVLEELFCNPDIRSFRISKEDTQRIVSLFEMLEYEADHPGKDDLQEQLLKIILKIAARYIPKTAKQDYRHNPIFKTLRFIQTHFREDISLENVAEHVGFSSQYLSRLFHKKLGISYKQYLTTIRVSYAQRLLETNNMKNIDICFESGFNSYSSFSRAFEKVVGTSPGKYAETKKNRR